MSIQPQNLQLTFGIISCKCADFSLSKYAQDNSDSPSYDKYQFGLAINLQVDEVNKTISVIIKSTLSKTSDGKEIIANLDAENKFNIVNLEQILIDTNPIKQLPDQVVIQLFSISVSNLRGMYAAKLQESVYSNACLPLVDVTSFIPKKTSPVG